MWRQVPSNQEKLIRRRSQDLQRKYSQIQMNQISINNTSQSKANVQRYKNQNHHGNQSNKGSVRSVTAHRIDGEAARRMIQSIKTTQMRLTQLKKQCNANCNCKVCKEFNFTRKVCIDNMNQVLWRGAVIIQPNTQQYRMARTILTYKQFWNIPLSSSIKIKYLIDKDLYVPIIKITSGQEKKQTKFLVNLKEGLALMVQYILAYLTVTHKYWTKFKYSQSMEGFVYRKYSLNGTWQKIFLRIQKKRIWQRRQFSKQQQILFKSACLWTSFQIAQWQMPHLIIKVWQGIWKVQYGLPIAKLSEWVIALLSLLKIQ